MNIELKLNKDFENKLDELSKKYGEDFLYINGIHPSQLDFSEFLGKFIDNKTMADATIDPNANANHKDIRSFMTEKAKSEDKLFGLAKIYLEIKKKYGKRTSDEWLEQEFTRGFYLNDSSSASYFPYCWANSLEKLAKEGLFFLNNYNNQPPKHLTTYFDDVIEFVSFLSNRQSGAVGLPDVLIYAYYFWKKDIENNYFYKDKITYLKQNFQKFIYRLNQPFLRIDQCAFTNVSIFDRPYIESLFGGVIYPDGSMVIDEVEEIIKFQKIFMETVSEIREQNMFTFPVLTFSLKKYDKEELEKHPDKIFEDEDFARWASKHNIKWADSNFFISDDVGVLSNCCRLLSNTKKLNAFVNSIGGTALSIGSCRVSTINLVRIAYEAFNYNGKKKFTNEVAKNRYLDILEDRVLLDCKALTAMRHILKRNIEKGLLPNYQGGAVELDKQYCTIGILGMYEVMDMFGLITTDDLGNKYYSKEADDFADKIFEVLNKVKDNFECEFTFNIEQIPGENCAGILCKADNILYEQDKYFIYSNQWIPLYENCTLQEKCRVSSLLDNKCSGGAIAHINIESRFANEEQAWNMLNFVAKNNVIYSAFTTKIFTCEDRHAFLGSKTCPICGKPISETFSRVVGFYTPISSYQKIRKKEWEQRKWKF